MSKGSNRRPARVPEEEVERNWKRIFGNQCDGCLAGLPVDENGNHYHPDKEGYERLHMGCEAERYTEETK